MAEQEQNIDPQKFFQQIASQRNSALDQGAQLAVLLEESQEREEALNAQLEEAATQLAEAHRKIAVLEGGSEAAKAD